MTKPKQGSWVLSYRVATSRQFLAYGSVFSLIGQHIGPMGDLIHPEILSDIYDMDIAVEIIGGKRIGVYYL